MSTGVAGQIEQKLLAALLNTGDLPSGLTEIRARQPYTNHDYALSAGGSNAAAFEKTQSDAGRVTGVVLNAAAPSGATSAGPINSLLVMLSDYASPAQAAAALPPLVQSVKPSTLTPDAYTVTRKDVALATIGDQTVAELFTISAVLGGQPDQLAWVVGVRRGAVVELYVFSGVGGAPSQQQVTELVTHQDANVAKAGL